MLMPHAKTDVKVTDKKHLSALNVRLLTLAFILFFCLSLGNGGSEKLYQYSLF